MVAAMSPRDVLSRMRMSFMEAPTIDGRASIAIRFRGRAPYAKIMACQFGAGVVVAKILRQFLRVTLRKTRANARCMKHRLFSLVAALAVAALVQAADAQKEVAVIKTGAGEMVIELWPDVAPK